MIHLKMSKALASDYARWALELSSDDSPMKVICICEQTQLKVLFRMSDLDCVSDKILNVAESSVMVGHPRDFMY
jgi:hypothetical protein